MIFEVAHWMGLVPLLWLAFLHFRGSPHGVEWWWLALVFGVSWIADTAAHFSNPWVMSKVYPLSQAAIVGLVLLSRRGALSLIVTLVLVGVLDVLWVGVGDFDILLRTVAWLSVAGIVYQLPQLARLRISLLVAFGIGWWCWMIYAIAPGWPSWIAYQLTRFIGILLFCWAATSPLPHFKLSRR